MRKIRITSRYSLNMIQAINDITGLCLEACRTVAQSMPGDLAILGNNAQMKMYTDGLDAYGIKYTITWSA